MINSIKCNNPKIKFNVLLKKNNMVYEEIIPKKVAFIHHVPTGLKVKLDINSPDTRRHKIYGILKLRNIIEKTQS